MSIVKLTRAAAIVLPALSLGACGMFGSDDRPQAAAATTYQPAQQQSAVVDRDYEATERMYSRGLRK